MRILYANHTSRVSGAERSLLILLGALPREVWSFLACPQGQLAERSREIGIRTVPLPEIDGSLRLHPLHTPRALEQLLRTGIALRRAARHSGAELIHANTIRAGLAAVFARRLGGPPVVAHVRDCLPEKSPVARLTRRLLVKEASLLIANSSYTAASFSILPPSRKIAIVYNPIDLARFVPGKPSKVEARSRLGISPSAPVLGVIAQLAPWKAQDDAIRAVGLLRENLPEIRLLIVGSATFTSRATRFNNTAYRESLLALGDRLSLNGSVSFLGEREDVPEILAALDILLVPSWQEPFGRSVIEAMAMGVPVVATNLGGPSEVITDGVDGILLAPKNPELWAATLGSLLAQPNRLNDIGRNGRLKSPTFDAAAHAQDIVNLYRGALGTA